MPFLGVGLRDQALSPEPCVVNQHEGIGLGRLGIFPRPLGRIEDFKTMVAILFCEDFDGSHYDSHPLQHYKNQNINLLFYYMSRDRSQMQ